MPLPVPGEAGSRQRLRRVATGSLRPNGARASQVAPLRLAAEQSSTPAGRFEKRPYGDTGVTGSGVQGRRVRFVVPSRARASGVTPLRLAGGLAAVVGGFPGVRGGAPTFGGWICGGCPAGWMVSPAERRQNFMKPGAGRCIPAMTRLSVRASCNIRLRAARASAGFMS